MVIDIVSGISSTFKEVWFGELGNELGRKIDDCGVNEAIPDTDCDPVGPSVDTIDHVILPVHLGKTLPGTVMEAVAWQVGLISCRGVFQGLAAQSQNTPHPYKEEYG